jgi:hypothetical protein
MKILKMRLSTQPQDVQDRRHGSLSGSQDRSDQQELRLLPNPFREKNRKGRQDRGIFAGQGRSAPSSWPSKGIAYLASC